MHPSDSWFHPASSASPRRRRRVWLLAGLFLLAATVGQLPASENKTKGPTPDEALARLIEGNKRFVQGGVEHPRQSADHRHLVAQGQSPFAIILTCADSRLSPELYFDQGIGDLFVVRNAGNILDDHVIGSIEYAVEHLHAPLIVVVGHAKCGAVSAAVSGGEVPGHIRSIVAALEGAVEKSKGLPGDKVENALRANAQSVAAVLRRVEPIIGESVKAGHVKVVAARYDLDSGQVELLP